MTDTDKFEAALAEKTKSISGISINGDPTPLATMYARWGREYGQREGAQIAAEETRIIRKKLTALREENERLRTFLKAPRCALHKESLERECRACTKYALYDSREENEVLRAVGERLAAALARMHADQLADEALAEWEKLK